MPDDRVLADHDPYELMAAEAARLETWFGDLGPEDWEAPSACEGWSVQDVLAHLAFGEEYNAACLDQDLPAFFERYTSRGAADVDAFNALGVSDRAGTAPRDVLDEWRSGCARTRTELRQRDGQEIVTAAGSYPARWQAWHLASELATHADDIDVPESAVEAESRAAWRLAFARFALDETRPDVTLEPIAGAGYRVRSGDAEAVLAEGELTAAVNGRLPADHPLDPALRATLTALA